MPVLRDPISAFWFKVKKTKACWIWRANKTENGYGIVKTGWYNGSHMMAHRLAWELSAGRIPDGMTIDHLCHRKLCVRPDHLRVVTMRENVLAGDTITGANSRKKSCIRGHPLSGRNLQLVTRGRNRVSRRCRTCENRSQRKMRQKPEWKRHHALYERERRRRLKEVKNGASCQAG
jgi:hypothetical protein